MSSLLLGLGGASAGGGAAVGGGIGLAGILTGVTTILSIASAIQEGENQALTFEDKAAEAEFDEGQQQAEGLRNQTALKQELLRALGENDVAYAAAGIDLGSGVAYDARQRDKKKASQEISIDRETVNAQRAMYRARAGGYLRLASDARSASMLRAVSAGISGFGSLVA